MTPSHAPAASDRRALAALAIATITPSLGISVANVALPTVAQAFAVSPGNAQWIVLAYLLTMTSAIVVVGRLGDLWGHRRVLMAGIAVFLVGSVAAALAPSFWALAVARAVQGLGGAAMMALTTALVASVTPKDKAGAAMGLMGGMSAIGTALGPTLGGALITFADWRAIFLVNIPLCLVALYLAHRHLPADHGLDVSVKALDKRGIAILAVTLALYAWVATSATAHFGWVEGSLAAAVVVGVWWFVNTQRRASSPIVDLTMFAAPGFTASLASNVIVATVMMTTLVVGPFHLSGALGLDIAAVGLVMSVGPCVSALTSAPAGRWADRAGTARARLAGLGAMVLGAGALAWVPVSSGVPGYLAALATLTAGYATYQTANNTLFMAGVPSNRRGVGAGMLSLARNLGLITGAGVMGALFARFAQFDTRTTTAVATANATHLTFASAAVLVVLAIALIIADKPRRIEQEVSQLG